MSLQRLTHQIEGLRSEMIRVADLKGSLMDPQVIALSQQLDQLLVVMQRIKKNGCGDEVRRYDCEAKQPVGEHW
jgi:hypothetical protein